MMKALSALAPIAVPLLTLAMSACAQSGSAGTATDTDGSDAAALEPSDIEPGGDPDGSGASERDAAPGDADGPTDVAGPDERPVIRVITINAGTSSGRRHDADEADGLPPYTSATSELVDEHYFNSLSWNPAERALTAWLATQNAQVVAFQEIFHDPWCDEIDRPEDTPLDLICSTHDPAGPLQVQRLTGDRYQFACGIEKPDTCIAIDRDWAVMDGCNAAGCVILWEPARPPSECTGRDRMGRVRVTDSTGQRFNIIAWHGTSGGTPEDAQCRADILSLAFEDRGDGTPLVDPTLPNLLLGDFNFDPELFVGADVDYIAQFVGAGRSFSWLSPTDIDGPRSYAGGVSIDHVVGDRWEGDCVIPGSSEGVPAVWDRVYWDHRPVVCDLRLTGDSGDQNLPPG
jgi:hypothetical protein